ncbi:Cysteine-rich receptor-like protein kinase 26 [Glycine soja]|uniref:Cysteine-rich receptor-like protein kinase 26 n=1 Tax=Glycine soja TaxID=3848 RepID=A0A445F4Q5_GLYSO|nr:Cysteine-rich receptor-like protein kinase 26 [Glycine soja]
MAGVSFGLLSFVLCLFIIITSQANGQGTIDSDLSVHICDNTRGNYTINSTYHNNLNTLFSSFSSHTEINYGFYNLSYGQGTDKVYAIGLCTGDENLVDCIEWLKFARDGLTQLCPNQKEAIHWRRQCLIRYSNRSIFGTVQNEPMRILYLMKKVTGSVDQFNAVVESLMTNLTRKAASGDSRRKYATGTTFAPNFQNINGQTQCTPDLSSEECTNCLMESMASITQCCSGHAGGIVLKPSCRFTFGPLTYYGPTQRLDPDSPPPAMAPPPSPSTNKTSSQSQASAGKSKTARTIIAITVPVASVVLALGLFCIFLAVRKPTKKSEIKREEDSHEDEITIDESLQFNFDTIRVATNEFDDSNKLGEGGFGAVYSGRLSNGQVIAVKRLSRDSGQGDMEFKSEVLLMAKLQHRNLVRLLGFCLEGRERLLVYEYVPNKSLDCFIFGGTKSLKVSLEAFSTSTRILDYELYRDLKASNILLDEEMHPKISDFGMARLVQVDQTQAYTNKIVGTYGYMAPEYAIYGQFSAKSDVFSFGVLVLEIVSGQKNTGICRGENVEDLLNLAWRNWKNGTATNIVDPSLNDGSQNEIMRCIHIALLCVQENVAKRPTMASIALMFNGNSLTLPVPSEPAFGVDSKSTNKSIEYSVDDSSITEPYPR